MTMQPATTRHLALGNLLPELNRTAIELAFSQYGGLEAVRSTWMINKTRIGASGVS